MPWGYLSEFWDAVTQVTITAGNYTVAWFESVGNAVAGAIGNLFEFINHSLSDIFIFGGWFFSVLSGLFTRLWLPVNYIFSFFSAFIDKAFETPETQNIWSFGTSTLAVFSAIPYWSSITLVLGVSVLLIVSVATLKLFLSS